MNFIEELHYLEIPENLIVKIHNHFGGCPVYIPKIKKVDLISRNAEICRRFTGRNYRQLSSEYNLSGQHIHKIIKDGKSKSITVTRDY